MNFISGMILDEYREQKPEFEELGDLVYGMVKSALDDAGIKVVSVEYRVKSEKSLAGKLEIKGDKYNTLSDITDILGLRVVCHFYDELDAVGDIMKRLFNVDTANSVDKRKKQSPWDFGYSSVHHICSLPDNGIYPENLCGKRFEIQIRSSLQHTWASINHDLGYKTDYGLPDSVVNDFSRVAGLLEIADQQFVYIRDSIRKYSDEIKKRISEGNAHDISIDSVSLSEYVKSNEELIDLNNKIAGLCSAQVHFVSPENYVKQLKFLGKESIGDLQEMVVRNSPLAFKLAAKAINGSSLDMVSSNVGLRFVCRAELLLSTYSRDQAARFLNISMGDIQRAKRTVEKLINTYEEINREDL